jgi:hypothetical protein
MSSILDHCRVIHHFSILFQSCALALILLSRSLGLPLSVPCSASALFLLNSNSQVHGHVQWNVAEQKIHFPALQALEGLRGAMGEGCAAVAEHASAASAAAAQDLAEQCAAVLKQLRGITATYRMTTRPAPTKASHYVASILAPLGAFLNGDPARRLSPDARAQIVQVRPDRGRPHAVITCRLLVFVAFLQSGRGTEPPRSLFVLCNMTCARSPILRGFLKAAGCPVMYIAC